MMRVKVDHDEAMRTRVGGTVLAVGAALALACGPDPGGKYDEFNKDVTLTAGASETGGEATTEAATGSTDDTGTGEPTTGGPVLFDISGDFLLAVSTTVDRSKPLQFIATNTVVETDGKQTLATCLQPLSLTAGKVLVPREPIGEPLCFMDLAIAGNKFTIDAGEVMVTGMANPITGSDITATLIMTGTIAGDDAYCGEVDGEVINPAIGSIAGSSFAAVRLTDTADLPTDVTIDCMGTTVTDK